MPTYNFGCRVCDNVVTLTVPIGLLDDDQFCDRCGGWLRRIFSAPGISFKGTGWGRDGK
jgi:putative FmdB family regulatory protein